MIERAHGIVRRNQNNPPAFADVRALAYDVETTGLEYHRNGKDTVFAYATCSLQQEFDVRRLDRPKTQDANMKHLRELWTGSGTRIPKIMHNAKFDIAMTEKTLAENLEGNVIHDTYVMAKLLMTDHYSHALDDLAWDLCEYTKKHDKAIAPYTPGHRGYQKVPEHLMDVYQQADVDRTMLLYLFFWPKIAADPRLTEIYNYEIRLLWATLRIEDRGMMINRTTCRSLIEELHVKELDTLRKIRSLTSPGFKPGNGDQVAHILYDVLKYPMLKKTGSGKRSVDKHVLALLREQRQDQFLDLIQAYRSWTRGQSIVASYMDLADRYGIIHPNIHTMGAQTGRESCTKPNLQNVEEEGRLLNPYPIPARRCFRPRPKCVNFHIDYKGIEMRIIIQYAQEPEMLDRMIRAVPDDDVHDLAAEVFYGKLYTEEKDPKKKKAMRNQAKGADFAIPYGAAWPKVAATLGLDKGAGYDSFSRYARRFPRITALSHDVVAEIKESGYATTLFGRRIYVPKNFAFKGMNYKVQGTAAEICKRAQVRIHDFLTREEPNVHMLLPIHDEIVFEIPLALLHRLDPLLRKIRALMIDFPQLDVPLEVDYEYTTKSWAEKKSYTRAS